MLGLCHKIYLAYIVNGMVMTRPNPLYKWADPNPT